MRELKIFVIVAFIIGVMYYGVEPLVSWNHGRYELHFKAKKTFR